MPAANEGHVAHNPTSVVNHGFQGGDQAVLETIRESSSTEDIPMRVQGNGGGSTANLHLHEEETKEKNHGSYFSRLALSKEGLSFDPGNFFRSEDMVMSQIFIESEAAYACVSALGEVGLVQFIDLNPEVNLFQRKFVGDVRRCDAMEQKLRFMDKEIKKDSIPRVISPEAPKAPEPREINELEATFGKLQQELKEVNDNSVKLKQNFMELTELKQVLLSTHRFFEEKDLLFEDNNRMISQSQIMIADPDAAAAAAGTAVGGGKDAIQLNFIAGVINRESLVGFERMLWRACRGNMLLRQSEITEDLEDPVTSNKLRRSVFVVFFQGEQLKSRVEKICDGYHGTRYPCPDSAIERRDMAKGVLQRIADLSTVLGQTNDQRRQILVSIAANIDDWFVKVLKIKAVYHTLNLFNLDVTSNCFVAECWIAAADVQPIQKILQRESVRAGASVLPVLNIMETELAPPTFFRTNKYTRAFQTLINNYGVASYKEMNPAVFSIVTFPFLFGVMFGDMGHGFVMFLFAAWMCYKEEELMKKKIDSEIWKIFFGGRYLIAFMGVFSVYSGFLYNDLFSKSLNVFGSSWHAHQNYSSIIHGDFDMISPGEPRGWYGVPYPFGTDPVWQIADNRIVFLNAFKMKLAIIVGVLQMSFGVVLSLQNHRFFNHRISIYFEFVPQIIFLCFMFGYLALLMMLKWCKYYANMDPEHFDLSERCAPSILITFINMVLFKANDPTDKGCDPFMYPGQEGLQKVLVIVAVACVPVLLLAKPLYLRKQNQIKLANEAALRRSSSGENVNNAAVVANAASSETDIVGKTDAGTAAAKGGGGGHGGEGEEFEFGEVLILQMIHTIEYVLGSVSHTASYLRLWALSLAHAQLSEVLWNMVLRIGLGMRGWYAGFILYAIFAMWTFCTVSILVLMEALSAFLHCLRLHWVEFQSKFYHGEGYLFAPYSFKKMLKLAEATP